MELRQLRYFVAISERLNFTRAAEDLLIAQPALSAQMQKLEAEVGAALFVRDKRHVELTDVGRMVLEEARVTLAHADRTLEVGRAGASGALGRLSIGYNRSFPLRPISALVKAFRSCRPLVDVRLRELSNHRQFEQLASGDLDMGFVMRPAAGFPEAFERHEVAAYPAVVGLPLHHPLAGRTSITLRELADEPFLLVDDRSGSESHRELVLEACRNAGFTPAVIQEAAEVRIVMGLIAAGLGVSVLSGAMREFAMPGLRLIPVAPGRTLQYGLVWREHAANSAVASFANVAKSVTRATYGASELVAVS